MGRLFWVFGERYMYHGILEVYCSMLYLITINSRDSQAHSGTRAIQNIIMILVSQDKIFRLLIYVIWWNRASLHTGYYFSNSMMTSSHGNISASLAICEENPPVTTKASDAELWCFHRAAPEQTIKQTIEAQVIWDEIALIITSL